MELRDTEKMECAQEVPDLEFCPTPNVEVNIGELAITGAQGLEKDPSYEQLVDYEIITDSLLQEETSNPSLAETTSKRTVKEETRLTTKTKPGNSVNTSTVNKTKSKKQTDSEDIVSIYMKQIGNVELLTKEEEVKLAKDREAGLRAEAIIAEKFDELRLPENRNKLRELQKQIEKGKQAEHLFVQSNLRLVVSIAKRYQLSGLPLLDLIQEGNLGLMHAVTKFDWQKGFKFSTYATWWIRQAITRGISNTNNTIRLPVHAADYFNKINRFKREFYETEGRYPTVDEIVQQTNFDKNKVVELLFIGGEVKSLDAKINYNSEAELQDFIADKKSEDDFEDATNRVYYLQIERMLSVLDDREKTVIEYRYGLGDCEATTLAELGEMLGVTRERIRQIEARAMAKLRKPQNLLENPFNEN